MEFTRATDQPNLPGLRTSGFSAASNISGAKAHENAWSHRSVSTTVAPTYYQPANPDRAPYQPANSERALYHPVNKPLYEPDPDIYEPIYDSRWRLLNQEAARLQRDGFISKSPTPVSSISSRESSVGPSGQVVCPSPSFGLLSNKSSKMIRIPRKGKDFGFTLRHFIVYPPEDEHATSQACYGGSDNVVIREPMESIFVKGIKHDGPAYLSGLEKGDRILTVNGESVERKTYSEVVHLIQATADSLQLVVVPKKDDALQIYFAEIAQNPETNQRTVSQDIIGLGPWTSVRENTSHRRGHCYEPVCAQPQTSQIFQHHHRMNHYRGLDGTFATSQSSDSLPEHAYAVPARVVEMSAESLTSLESGSTGFTQQSAMSSGSTGINSFPTTPDDEVVYFGNQSAALYHRMSQNEQQQQQFQGPTLQHHQQRPSQVFQRPLPPIPLKPVEQQSLTSKPVEQPSQFTSTSTRRKFSTGAVVTQTNRPGQAKDTKQDLMTRSALTESTTRTRSIAHDPNRRASLADCSGARTKSVFSPEHAVSSRLVESTEAMYSELSQPEWASSQGSNGPARSTARSCSQRSFNLYGTPTDYKVPKAKEQSPEKIVRLCRETKENIRTVKNVETNVRPSPYRSTDTKNNVKQHEEVRPPQAKSESSNVRQSPYKSIDAKDYIRQEETNLRQHNKIEKDRKSPFRQRDVINVRQSPFRHKDMDNVRHITSVIIERTPEQVSEEPVYSTVSEASEVPPAVIRKNKRTNLADRDEMNLRRISYLMATQDDVIQTGTPIEEECEDVFNQNLVVDSGKSCTDGSKQASHGVNKILSVFGKKSDSPTSPKLSDTGRKIKDSTESTTTMAVMQDSLKEGWLEVLVSSTDGKKNDANHWKSVYTVAKSDAIYFHRDKGPASSSSEQHSFIYNEIPLSLKKCDFIDAAVFSVQQNIFKLLTDTGTVLLLKAESEQLMLQWLQALNELIMSTEPKKLKIRKNVNSRTRSPASQSPASKSRKATTTTAAVATATEQVPEDDKDGKKTWKGKVAKQWKKMQGTTPITLAPYPEGGSIGVPIEECPRSEEPGYECIPLLVQLCCSIVEERGLEIIGIYRVPGNSAAVTYLTEQVNRGVEYFKMDDPRWSDVNVVSSLLKSFFRKLPDPLFTLDMYGMFIEVSKIEDSLSRLNALKRLVHNLPEINFETLKLVCFHLTKVISNCHINKMELRNLAIVFGPTLVRTSDDNMLSMITDMAQQCRIIESMLSNCEWFFNPESTDLQISQSMSSEINKLTADTEITQTGHQSLLLTNLQKLEGSGKVASPNREVVSAKDIVSGIISAANQKMLRTNKNKKDSVDSGNVAKYQADISPASRRYSEAILHGAVAMADTASRLIENHPHQQQQQDFTTTTAKYAKSSFVNDQRWIVKTESAPHLIETSVVAASDLTKDSAQSSEVSSVIETDKHLKNNADPASTDSVATSVILSDNSQASNVPDQLLPQEPTNIINLSKVDLPKEKTPLTDLHLGFNVSHSSIEFIDSSATEFDLETDNYSSANQADNHYNSVPNTVIDNKDIENVISYIPVYENSGSAKSTSKEFHRSLSKSESFPGEMNQLSYKSVYSKKSAKSPDATTHSSSALLTSKSGNNWAPQSPTIEMLTLNGLEALYEENLRQNRSRDIKGTTHDTFVSRNYLSTANQAGLGISERVDHTLLSREEKDQTRPKTNIRDQEKIKSLTENFDEKLRLLLDPHYHPSHTVTALGHPASTSHSRSTDNDLQSWVGPSDNSADALKNRKTDLKRNKNVEKGREPLSTTKRNNSLTKREKQEINARKKVAAVNSLTGLEQPTVKQLKTMENKRRIKRRHTVGGTKDIPLWEKENYVVACSQDKPTVFYLPAPSKGSSTLIIKKVDVGSSSPDLLFNNRRLSLPEPV